MLREQSVTRWFIPIRRPEADAADNRPALGRRHLVAVFVAALLVRIVFCFAVYPHISEWFGPGDDYDVIALHLVHGEGYTLHGRPAAAERLPLYPALLAASFWLFGAAAWPWQLMQAAFGAATCALVLRMASRHADQRSSLAAAAVCAIHPTFVLYTVRPLTETLYIFLFILFVNALTQPRRRALPVGALWGLQLLVKSTAVLHAVAFIPALTRRQVRFAIAAAATAALVVLPWVGWNLVTTGRADLFTATSGRALYDGLYISRHVSWTVPEADLNRRAEMTLLGELTARGVSPDAGVVQRDRLAGEIARAWIAAHPLQAMLLWLRNCVLTWYLGRSRASMLIHGWLHGILLIAASIGAVRWWRRSAASRDLVAVSGILVLTYTFFHAGVQPAIRYILPVVPLVIVLAAGAIPLPARGGWKCS